jgi:hypothetical protein
MRATVSALLATIFQPVFATARGAALIRRDRS